VLEFLSPKVARLRRRRDVAGLLDVLRSGGERDRRAAANALIAIPDPRTVEPLTAALKDADPLLRTNAALALGELQDGRPDADLSPIVEPLVEALRDPAPEVRAMAASALGRTRTQTALEPLIQALQDSSTTVRLTAKAVLAGYDDPRAREAVAGA
jgi:HEAT repeat protein